MTTDPGQMPSRRRRIPIFVRIMIALLGLLTLSYFAFFFGLNYFGEKFLRRYVKQELYRVSGGLYNIDFNRLNINIVTGNITLHDLELSPDTVLYNSMKNRGTITRALYRVSIKSLSFGRMNYLQIWSGHRIKLNRIEFVRPKIGIVGFPDTVTARMNRWRVIYEDIYPLISKVFNDFHVDSITVIHGLLLTTFRQKTGRLSIGEYEFSSILRDVSVNPFSYYNRERVFYSKDIDWIIHDLQLSLADSLYFLKAEQVGFSLSRSRLWGRSISLIPNFHSARLKSSPAGDFFQVNIPDFFIEGIDLYKALVDKAVEIDNVEIQKVRFKIFRNNNPAIPLHIAGKKKRIRPANIYTIISGALKSVSVDSFSIKNASIEYYGNLYERNPELRIAQANLNLSDFYLDSLAHRNKKKIYYSDHIDLSLRNISMRLRDRIHFLNSDEVWLSTRKSRVGIRYTIIYSDKNANLHNKNGPRNTIYCLAPGLEFYNIDLRKAINEKILDFDRLEVLEPDLTYTKFRNTAKSDPRFRSPKDFFQEENEEVVYDLLKKYVKRIKGNTIQLLHGQAQFLHQIRDTAIRVASASVDLTMQDFLIDSLHGLNRQGYFYSRDFLLDINNLYFSLPDSATTLTTDYLHISTSDSLITARNFSFFRMSNPLPSESGKRTRPGYDYTFTSNEISVLGLNHRKLFLEKILKAGTIILEKPCLHVEAGIEVPDNTPAEERASGHLNFPRTFEIGRFLVRNGSLFFDGREEEKVAYFSIQDVDFGVTDAVLRIPPPGGGRKELEFDSLQLSVFPVNIVLADSTYSFRCNSLSAHSYPTHVIASGVSLVPLKQLPAGRSQQSLINMTIGDVYIRDFYFDKAVFDKQWLIGEIELKNPRIIVHAGLPGSDHRVKGRAGGEIPVKLPLFMKSIEVKKTSIDNGILELRADGEDTAQKMVLTGIDVVAGHLKIDSSAQANPRKAPLFYCDDVTASSDGYSWIPADSMYTFSFRKFGFSTKEQSAWVDTFTVKPNYSRYDFSRKFGRQADRLEFLCPAISFEHVDFRKLFQNREIFLGKIVLQDAIINSYRDRRVPLSKTHFPLLPAQRIRKAGIPLTVDTIMISNGRIGYEEQTGEVPGRISLDRVNLRLLNLTTDTSRWNIPMTVTGSTYLMDKALIEADFRIPLNTSNDTFSIVAHVGEMELSDINPMLSNLMPVRIRNGKVKKIEIKQIRANNDLSTGDMIMHYDNIDIELQNTEPGTWKKWETALKTFIFNWILPDSNPTVEGKTRRGYIYFERDKNKGFFNYIWKSTLSGVKSSFGFNTKEQKELKRADKKRRK